MQDLVTLIENAIRNHTQLLQLPSNVSKYDVACAIKDLMRENPDIFWFSHQWSYIEAVGNLQLYYTFDKERCRKIKSQVEDAVVHDFKLSYVSSLPVVAQVMYVYKWIALYCEYSTFSAHNQTIYSVFVYRRTVCTGIAKAAQYLLKKLGIVCKLVYGRLYNSQEDSRHCWLLVQIEDKWYHLDPTFAMQNTWVILSQSGVTPITGRDLLNYNFFCVDTKTVKQSRTIEFEGKLPSCHCLIDYKLYQDILVTPSRNGKGWDLGCILSDKGCTADVYVSFYYSISVSLRSVAKKYRNDSNNKLLSKELRIMREYYGAHLLRPTNADFDKGILYIEQATPLAEMLASSYYKLSIHDFCHLLIDVASGLKELLNGGVYYKDIHLNNIYLKDIDGCDYIYMLGDFCDCSYINDEAEEELEKRNSAVGSKWYMAPETWMKNHFDERSSVYGVGMIAYYLLNNLFPPLWQKYGEDSFQIRMQLPNLPKPSLLNDSRFAHLKLDFIDKALMRDASQRQQTLDELISDISDFLSQKSDLASTILIDCDSFKRNGGADWSEEFACTTASATDKPFWHHGTFENPSRINDFATTSVPLTEGTTEGLAKRNNKTFIPKAQHSKSTACSPMLDAIPSFIGGMFGIFIGAIPLLFSRKSKLQDVNSAIFAPSEVKCGDDMMVQVFLYLDEEEQFVAKKAIDVDPFAKRRNYTSLSVKLQKGDKVKVCLNMPAKDVHVDEPMQELVWRGGYVDCQFAVFVGSGFDASVLLGTVVLMVNNVPVGRMMFRTNVVNNPCKLYAEIDCKRFNHVFISYAHQDGDSVRFMAEAYKAQGVDYFYDRHTLEGGSVYEEVIRSYIEKADLFLLCWSTHAASSSYVQKEIDYALVRAYPIVSKDKATLTFYPIDIAPRAPYPERLNAIYNFVRI